MTAPQRTWGDVWRETHKHIPWIEDGYDCAFDYERLAEFVKKRKRIKDILEAVREVTSRTCECPATTWGNERTATRIWPLLGDDSEAKRKLKHALYESDRPHAADRFCWCDEHKLGHAFVL